MQAGLPLESQPDKTIPITSEVERIAKVENRKHCILKSWVTKVASYSLMLLHARKCRRRLAYKIWDDQQCTHQTFQSDSEPITSQVIGRGLYN